MKLGRVPFVRCLAGAFSMAMLARAGSPAVATEVDPAQIRHEVRAGDTLYGIAARYLEDPSQWPVLQRINRVSDPMHLTPGLILGVPLSLRRLPAQASMLYQSGSVTITGDPGRPASAIEERAGMAPVVIEAGSRVEVSEGGFAVLQLPDGSKLRLTGGSSLKLQRLARDSSTSTRLQLESGRLESEVTSRKGARSRFEVRTPLAVAGVRGTRFGVALSDGLAVTSDVSEGAVELRSVRQRRPSEMIRAGQGASVDALGRLQAARALPAAPALSGLPAVIEDAERVALELPGLAPDHAYRVEIAQAVAPDRVVRNGVFTSSQVRFGGLPDGEYVLVARVQNEAGLAGIEARRALKVNARPAPPFAVLPAPGARTSTRTVSLRWTAVEGAVSYRLQVATGTTCETIHTNLENLVATTLDLELADDAHCWRLSTVSAGEDEQADAGPYSPWLRFSVEALPQAPMLSDAGTDPSGELSLHWAGLPGQTFKVQVAQDAEFVRLLREEELLEPRLQLGLLPVGRYYVRIQVVESGRVGAYGVARILEVQDDWAWRTPDGRALSSGDGRDVTRMRDVPAGGGTAPPGRQVQGQ